MGKKIIVITDMDTVGSGYKYICTNLLTKLAEMGHDIKVAGLMYRGEEHHYPFSVIPSQSLQEAVGISTNFMHMINADGTHIWLPDVILVALDLPAQGAIYNHFAPYKKKYVAITPLENGPLCMTWGVPLFNMDKVFFISDLGRREAEKIGLTNADHIQVGVDSVLWHPATPEEKSQMKKGLGIPEDAFVVLTVADNQERKNLWAGLAAIYLLTHDITQKEFRDIVSGKSDKKYTDFPRNDMKVRYMLVTRVENPYGYKLKDLITMLGIKDECILFERGMPSKDLWGLYAASDVYLQPSKAEGLGLPLLDAMSSGIPVVATDTGAMTELLSPDRGHLVPPEYTFTDVWGNSKRDMISIPETYKALRCVAETNCVHVEKALEYARSRTWDVAAKHFDDVIKEMFNE